MSTSDEVTPEPGESSGGNARIGQPKILVAEPAVFTLTGYAPTITIHGPTRCDVNDAVGQSRSHFLDDETLEVFVDDAPLRGTSNERNVKHVLEGALRSRGIAHSFEEGDDAEGEDGFLVLSGICSVLQIVTVPVDPRFGASASTGSATWRISIDEGAKWIHAAVEKKARKYVEPKFRATMILALDARHIGKLSDERFLEALRANHPPISAFGFPQVWLVGPIGPTCVRLA